MDNNYQVQTKVLQCRIPIPNLNLNKALLNQANYRGCVVDHARELGEFIIITKGHFAFQRQQQESFIFKMIWGQNQMGFHNNNKKIKGNNNIERDQWPDCNTHRANLGIDPRI